MIGMAQHIYSNVPYDDDFCAIVNKYKSKSSSKGNLEAVENFFKIMLVTKKWFVTVDRSISNWILNVPALRTKVNRDRPTTFIKGYFCWFVDRYIHTDNAMSPVFFSLTWKRLGSHYHIKTKCNITISDFEFTGISELW